MTPETWLDIMPVIPLARGVPIVTKSPSYPEPWRGVVVGQVFEKWRIADPHSTEAVPVSHLEKLSRVDLDDPIGFGHALRWLGSLRWSEWEHHSEAWNALLLRWALGDIRDVDRLALARMCAEAVRAGAPTG